MLGRATLDPTYVESALATLLEQGASAFGPRVVEEKRFKVYQTLHTLLALHPRTKRPHRRLGLVVYPITGTPFVLLYDYDDTGLRVHFMLHRRASLRDLDPTSAEW